VHILGLHHVSLNVIDVEESVAFYTDVLGGALRDDRPELGFDGAWLDVGPQQLHLLDGRVPEDLGQHLALRVGDLDATVVELRARAIEVSDPVAIGTGRQSFTHDPSGNLVELHETG
jgi:glyoxylase I family protein